MIAFHIDMNVAQFRGDYLEQWLQELALRGYDTILWEVENNVEWETCPECVSPEAFTKKQFKKLMTFSQSWKSQLMRQINLWKEHLISYRY